VRRVIVSVIGATLLLFGIALLVLPGPAFIVIPLGLAILASEYAWARRWLKRFAGWPAMSFPAVASQPRITPTFSFTPSTFSPSRLACTAYKSVNLASDDAQCLAKEIERNGVKSWQATTMPS